MVWTTAGLSLIHILLARMPRLDRDEAYLFMGHGSAHPANAAYALVENTFRYHGAERVYVGTVEGFPHLDYVLSRLHQREIAQVHLAPLMIVAGDHAHNDLAGEGEDSWKMCIRDRVGKRWAARRLCRPRRRVSRPMCG